MSAALPPKQLSPDNPVNSSSVSETLEPLGLSVAPNEEKHYETFLKGIWEIWNRVDKMDDYVPMVDEERFPRENVHRPTGKDNQHNAWAWKATIKDQQKNDGLLKGKTVALKVGLAASAFSAFKGLPRTLNVFLHSMLTRSVDS